MCSRHICRQNLHILVLRDVNRTILSVGLTDRPTSDAAKNSTCPSAVNGTRGQSNLTKSASRGAHSPVMGHPRGSKVVPLNSWGRVSY